MANLSLYFNLNESLKLAKYRIYDIGKNQNYFDKGFTENSLMKNYFESYLDMTNTLLEIISEKSDFKISLSISGFVIEAIKEHCPKLMENLKSLAKSGNVEFILEPYYNSISSLYSEKEFLTQVEMQKESLKKHFGIQSVIFKNTELIYSNSLSSIFAKTGVKGVLVGGSQRLLRENSPNYLYQAPGNNLYLFPRNYDLSCEISSLRDILDVKRLVDDISLVKGDIINLYFDLNSFNRNNIDYFKDFVEGVLKNGNRFVTPSFAIENFKVNGKLDVPFVTSQNRCETIDYLTGNRLQESAQEELYSIERSIKNSGDDTLISNWRKLTCVSHFFYMNLEGHFKCEFENCYNSPYDAYIYFMNALNDIILRIKLTENNISLKSEGESGLDNKNSNKIVLN